MNEGERIHAAPLSGVGKDLIVRTMLSRLRLHPEMTSLGKFYGDCSVSSPTARAQRSIPLPPIFSPFQANQVLRQLVPANPEGP